jgi:hypothetical protein
MVKFVQIDPSELEDGEFVHRGRVSYPICKGFLETGFYVAKVDRTGMQQSAQSLSMSLRSYIKNHKLPIKMFQRKGDIYLMRLDIDSEGNSVEDWDEESKARKQEAVPITDGEVAKRFAEEKDKVTK